jgi:hypothetical protein
MTQTIAVFVVVSGCVIAAYLLGRAHERDRIDADAEKWRAFDEACRQATTPDEWEE